MKSKTAPWIEQNVPFLRDKQFVTVSMEGYIPELQGHAREANTKGGLGAYFGDKLEGLSAIGLHRAFGCMPLYHKRLVQEVRNGHQTISYQAVSYEDQPVAPLLDAQQQPVRLEVWGFDTHHPNQEVPHHVQVFHIDRGGTPLFLFFCPDVFDVLYPDNATHHRAGRRHRFLQETVFAQCVHQLLLHRQIVPDALLINEGHVAVAAAITRGDPTFDKTAIIYTNHTVVSAGLEVFHVDDLADNDIERARYIMRFPPQSWQELWQKFIVETEGKVLIDFSKGAMEICSAANAVSAEHARVTRALFPNQKKNIVPILNGSGDTWVLDDLLDMERQGIEPTAEQLTAAGQHGKALAFEGIRQRTAAMTNRYGDPIDAGGRRLDPAKPTLWLARRMVAYKSQYPILKEIVHVLCADRSEKVMTHWGPRQGLGMQVVVSGIAPQNSHEEQWIESFVNWMQWPHLNGRFVYVPGCDTEVLRWQAVGADICLNCPQPNKEACGTSDQRSARNGGINIAVYSGGPPEYLEDHKSGMLIGPYINNKDFFEFAPRDILEKLTLLSEMYYAQPDGDMRWPNMKLQAYRASRKVTAKAMEERYAFVYEQAIHDREQKCQQEQSNVKVVRLPNQILSQQAPGESRTA